MARAHEIAIAADAKAFDQGIRDGVIKPLEKAEDALDDLADAADDAGREGSRGLDRLEDALKDAQRQAKKTEDAVDDIGEGGKKGFRKLSDAAEETSSELRQNLGETFSSFRGDLEDLPQIAQDVFGGLAGSVDSMVGSFALAGGAAGIGLLIAAFQEVQKQEQERKTRIAEWTQAYIDGLSTMEDAVANFATVEAIYTDPSKYDEAVKNAKNWHVTVSTAANAMAGDMTALSVVEQNLADNTAVVDEAVSKLGNGGLKGLSYEMRTLKGETSAGQDAFDKLTGEMDQAKTAAAQYSESLLNIARNAESAEVSVDDLGNTVYALPDGQQIMIDAKTGQATADLTKFKGDADGVIDHVNGKDVQLSVRAATDQARRDVDGFIASVDGKSFKIRGKVVTSGWDQ